MKKILLLSILLGCAGPDLREEDLVCGCAFGACTTEEYADECAASGGYAHPAGDGACRCFARPGDPDAPRPVPGPAARSTP